MKAVYKWRLENGVYGYITNEQDESAFIYDQTTFEREYPDGTVISSTSVDEPLIANIVSKKSKAEYIEMFNEFKAFVNIEYPDVAFLDVMYYYNVENDECSASAGSLKCAGADVLFRVKDVTSGLDPKVTVEPINSNPELGDLSYDMSFVLPIAMVSGGTNVFSALTSNTINVLSSVTAEEFVKNGGTNEQYLMADGSISVLSAGTNVTISTATTTYGKIVTVSSKDTNTWRNVNVNGSQILNNSITSGLTLSAGTNVTLTTSNNGSYKVVTIKATDTNTWRAINVNGNELIGSTTNSGLTLSAGTNVTLTTSTSGTNKVVKISAASGRRSVLVNGTEILSADSTSGLSLSAGTNVTLTTATDGTNKKVTIGATDTKNTTGSKHSTSKLYLIGATARTVNDSDGTQTYSNAYVYEQNGGLCANALSAKTISAITISADTVSAINDVKVNGTSIAPPIGTVVPWLGHFVYSAYNKIIHLTDCGVPDGWVGAVGSNFSLKYVGYEATGTSLTFTNTINKEDFLYVPSYNILSEHEEDPRDFSNTGLFFKFRISGYRVNTNASNGYHHITDDSDEQKIWTKFFNMIRLSCTYGQYPCTTVNLNASAESLKTLSIYTWRYQDSGATGSAVSGIGEFNPLANCYYLMKLPDLRQKFIVGSTDCLPTYGNTTRRYGLNGYTSGVGAALSVGQTGGEENHILTKIEMPSHNHNLNNLDDDDKSYFVYEDAKTGITGGNIGRIDTVQGAESLLGVSASKHVNTTTEYAKMITETGGGESHNNIPPYIALNFIIRYK